MPPASTSQANLRISLPQLFTIHPVFRYNLPLLMHSNTCPPQMYIWVPYSYFAKQLIKKSEILLKKLLNTHIQK